MATISCIENVASSVQGWMLRGKFKYGDESLKQGSEVAVQKAMVGFILSYQNHIWYKGFHPKWYLATVNPQNYTIVNFRESAQYSNHMSKIFAIWWHNSKSAMPLINFHTFNFHKSQSFAKMQKLYS